MRFRIGLVVLAVVVLISGLSYAGWKFVQTRESHACRACLRHIHEQTRTVAVVDGKRRAYCCPACALSQTRQTGVPGEIISLTEYRTGSHLNPQTAFIVRGSDVNTCSHHITAVGLDKQPVESHFDRCSPSLIAFGDREEAGAFARQHGGRVLRFADAAATVR